jgi:hypothetical protein
MDTDRLLSRIWIGLVVFLSIGLVMDIVWVNVLNNWRDREFMTKNEYGRASGSKTVQMSPGHTYWMRVSIDASGGYYAYIQADWEVWVGGELFDSGRIDDSNYDSDGSAYFVITWDYRFGPDVPQNFVLWVNLTLGDGWGLQVWTDIPATYYHQYYFINASAIAIGVGFIVSIILLAKWASRPPKWAQALAAKSTENPRHPKSTGDGLPKKLASRPHLAQGIMDAIGDEEPAPQAPARSQTQKKPERACLYCGAQAAPDQTHCQYCGARLDQA